ncbi:hypothetical protein [Massilia mucilaginosa]|nr:hypothetical protein [Massilia mucilaginosa]
MKKIVAEVTRLKDDFLYPTLYCIGDDGNVDGVVTSTLCDTVWALRGPLLGELLGPLDGVSSGWCHFRFDVGINFLHSSDEVLPQQFDTGGADKFFIRAPFAFHLMGAKTNDLSMAPGSLSIPRDQHRMETASPTGSAL